MNAHDLKLGLSVSLTTTTSNNKDEELYSIPLDISDIINICREYNKLGWQIQNQVENILELGVEETIKSGIVKKESLSQIKNFLEQITKNAYFGDAITQAEDCIELIKQYQDKYKVVKISTTN